MISFCSAIPIFYHSARRPEKSPRRSLVLLGCNGHRASSQVGQRLLYTQDVGGSNPSLPNRVPHRPATIFLMSVRCGAGMCCPTGACLRRSKRHAGHRAEEHPLRPPCGKPEICQLEILLRFIKRLDRFCFPFSALGNTRERGPPLSADM